jgi:DNA-binding SARP family transcriptional activator
VSTDTVTAERAEPRTRAANPGVLGDLSLRLLSSFALTSGGDIVDLPLNVQRLVIFLSLQVHPLHRSHVAGTLWPDTTDQRASANLRSALWRLNQLGCRLIVATGSSLQVAPGVRIDLHENTARARQILRDDQSHLEELDDSLFYFDLLPDWYDDWLVIERERFHQLRLRALECVCERLTASGRFARAIEAGLAAVAADPMRESAHRALVKLHLAEGNRAEAVRQFKFYRQILQDELGLSPSPQIIELLRH